MPFSIKRCIELPATLYAPIKRVRKQNKRIRKIRRLYPGNHLSCPLCKHTFGGFMPFTNPYPISITADIVSGQSIEHHSCPYCYCTDRERKLYFYFQQREGFFLNKRVLHFAPEQGLYNFLAHSNCNEYITADLYPEGYKIYAKTIQKIDICNITYPEGYFDIVLCNHVLEHIPDDKAAIREIFRVLKPEGIAILLVPMSAKLKETYENPAKVTEEDRATEFGQTDHVRIYAEADYIRRIASTGFEVEITDAKLTPEEIIKYGINAREKIYIARKPRTIATAQ